MEKNLNQLMVLKCQQCHRLFVPPKYSCPQCAGTEFKEVALSGKGRILTYTTIRIPPLGFESQVPYNIAIIELSEGINLTARLDAKKKAPEIGGEVFFLKKEGGTYWFESTG